MFSSNLESNNELFNEFKQIHVLTPHWDVGCSWTLKTSQTEVLQTPSATKEKANYPKKKNNNKIKLFLAFRRKAKIQH